MDTNTTTTIEERLRNMALEVDNIAEGLNIVVERVEPPPSEYRALQNKLYRWSSIDDKEERRQIKQQLSKVFKERFALITLPWRARRRAKDIFAGQHLRLDHWETLETPDRRPVVVTQPYDIELRSLPLGWRLINATEWGTYFPGKAYCLMVVSTRASLRMHLEYHRRKARVKEYAKHLCDQEEF